MKGLPRPGGFAKDSNLFAELKNRLPHLLQILHLLAIQYPPFGASTLISDRLHQPKVFRVPHCAVSQAVGVLKLNGSGRWTKLYTRAYFLVSQWHLQCIPQTRAL